MQPYQEASEEIQRQQQAPGGIAKKVGAALLTAGGSAAGISKIAPFLSKYIPPNIAIQGLSKINPKMAGFMSSSLGQGFSFDAIKDFLGNKIEQEPSKEKTNPPDQKNIIQKYSPGLHQFISQLIQRGNSPAKAAELARNRYRSRMNQDDSKRIKEEDRKIIEQMEKDYKTDWLSIVESIYGKGDIAQQGMQSNQNAPQQPQQQTRQTQSQPGVQPGQDNSYLGLLARRQQAQQQGNQGQMGPGQQQLRSILDQIINLQGSG